MFKKKPVGVILFKSTIVEPSVVVCEPLQGSRA